MSGRLGHGCPLAAGLDWSLFHAPMRASCGAQVLLASQQQTPND